MDKTEFKQFLKRFDLSNEYIDDILNKLKFIETKEGHTCVLFKDNTDKNIMKGLEVSSLFFLNLSKKVPTRYLYDFLVQYCGVYTDSLVNDKHLQKVLYGKEFPVSALNRKDESKGKGYFVLLYEKNPIGICKIKDNDKKRKNELERVSVVYNIGDYLKER